MWPRPGGWLQHPQGELIEHGPTRAGCAKSLTMTFRNVIGRLGQPPYRRAVRLWPPARPVAQAASKLSAVQPIPNGAYLSIMTSEALITAATVSPTLRPSSSYASGEDHTPVQPAARFVVLRREVLRGASEVKRRLISSTSNCCGSKSPPDHSSSSV